MPTTTDNQPMTPALIIAGLAMQYGIPLALEIAKLLEQKTAPTLDQWNAAFALAETPYGLTPQLPLPLPPAKPLP